MEKIWSGLVRPEIRFKPIVYEWGIKSRSDKKGVSEFHASFRSDLPCLDQIQIVIVDTSAP
jgi:hypothetical protein